MAKVQVICPRCSEWREDEVSDEEIAQRMCADALPIDKHCGPCKDAMDAAFDAKHPHLGCCGS